MAITIPRPPPPSSGEERALFEGLPQAEYDAYQKANQDFLIKELESKTKLRCLQIDLVKDNIDIRKEYVPKIFILVLTWIIFVSIVLVLSALKPCFDFELSDSVLIALLTTTTVNIISLLVLILKDYFPGNMEVKA